MKQTIVRWMFPLSVLLLAVLGVLGEEPDSMVVRLIVRQISVCSADRTLELEAVITNNSGTPIDFTPDGLNYGLELSRKEASGKELRRHIVREIEPDLWQTVGPRQTIIVPFKESLADPFFNTPGFYTIIVRYGSYRRKGGVVRFEGVIDSNSALFEIQPCRIPE